LLVTAQASSAPHALGSCRRCCWLPALLVVLLLALLLVLLLSWAWHLRSGQHSTAQRTLAGPWHTVPLDVIHAQHMRHCVHCQKVLKCVLYCQKACNEGG
jgi:hypothetical protein